MNVHTELYTTVAQVLPVFLLALMWDSAYLDRLRAQHRPRRGGPQPGYFWTKPRVRLFILGVTVAVMCTVLLTVLVLAGAVADSAPVRAVVVGGLVLAMAVLAFRIWVDVLAATRLEQPDDNSGSTG
ncbi:hypothetical protein MXD61_11480 [Frankia sp. AgPm24]|uniref:hypothetical protein n=1 Tax=Frankia sp. AgPm24 TaxID=631128 RepID=UPI00200EA42F|nr:hypothetical protein [Frankia sp. AgPm24]MCK9922492.1 hypothetical protein [Frankia sp. AgPm24]